VTDAGIYACQRATEFHVFKHRYAGQPTDAPIHRGSQGKARAEILVMAGPWVVRVGVERRFEFGGKVLIGGILQVAEAQGGGHLRSPCRVGDDPSPNRVRALSYRIERGREPGRSGAGIAIGGADHTLRTTNREQATTRFIHEKPTRVPHIRLM